jgi:dTDP-4-amino-4,6-dideoxygalactose transaminase
MIPFNKPPQFGNEMSFISEAIGSGKISGDGAFTIKCHQWFEQKLGCAKALLTPSCTHALEMAAILIDIQPGDEVIMPSYTFVSTANAFVLRGAVIKFVDIRPDTKNINEALIEAAITERTKAIVPVHYAGVCCDMDAIMKVADRFGLYVIEDAAQGMSSTYQGKPVGSIGHMAAYSFHETKNYTSAGEGGLLIINDRQFVEKAEIIREKGTNRSQFFRGMVDKYSWVDVGSSYLPSDVQAAYLWGQLLNADTINQARLAIWDRYYRGLSHLADKIQRPVIPSDCTHNAHMFYIILETLEVRTQLIEHLKADGVMAVFHYVPLHSSKAGKMFGHFVGKDEYTSMLSDCLLRLPLWYGMTENEIDTVLNSVDGFFKTIKA